MRNGSRHRNSQEQKSGGGPSTAIAGEASSPVLLLTVLSLLVVGATFLAHRPALSAQVISFDDDQYLTDNTLVRHPSWESTVRFFREVSEPSTVAGYYQPLTMVSLMLDCACGGRPDDLRAFHRTSLILHAANTVMVVILLYMLFGQPWTAAMVGLLFGVHPLTVETIPWIGERKTLLAAFFALGCLIVYVRYVRGPNWKLLLACVVFYVLALLSKPTSTPLPLAMLLMDFWPLRRLSRRAVAEKLPLLVLAVIFSVITVVSQARTARVDLPSEYPQFRIVLTLCHNIVFYLCKIVYPAHLSSHYPFPQPFDLSDPMILGGVIGTCILIPALIISLRWTRAFLTGWLIFFVAIFPTLGVLGFTTVIASDKYVYLPAIGLLLILGRLLDRIWSGTAKPTRAVRRVGMLAAVLAAAAVLTAGTRDYLTHWRSTESLLDYMLTLAPNSPQLLVSRGRVYETAGDLDRAVQSYERAIALRPDYAVAHGNRGVVYYRKGCFDQAITDCTRAIQLNPRYARAYSNRAAAYYEKDQLDQALRDCTQAIELRPDWPDTYSNRATVYDALKEYDKAWADVSKCRELGGTPNASLVGNLRKATGRSE